MARGGAIGYRAAMTDLTVAVPVFNGEADLDATLWNIRRQTASDFAIVVYDNASTDATPEIAARHAEEDPRISVVRRPENIGLVPNFVAAVREARTEFFAWHAVDDVWSCDYVAELGALLRASPGAWLAVPGQIVQSTVLNRTKRRPLPFPLSARTPRLLRILRAMSASRSAWLYGMWRRDPLLDAYGRVLDGYPAVYVHDTLVVLQALLRDAVTGSDVPTFTQRVGHQKMYDLPASAAGRRAVWADFVRFCHAEIARLDCSAAGKAVLHAYIPKFADKRCMRIADLARWSLAERLGLKARGLSEYA